MLNKNLDKKCFIFVQVSFVRRLFNHEKLVQGPSVLVLLCPGHIYSKVLTMQIQQSRTMSLKSGGAANSNHIINIYRYNFIRLRNHFVQHILSKWFICGTIDFFGEGGVSMSGYR